VEYLAFHFETGREDLRLDATENRSPIDSNEEVFVAPGAVVEKDFVLERRTLAVRIADSKGQPISGRAFRVWCGGMARGRFTTDGDGRLTVDAAPRVSFDLRCWPNEFSDEAAPIAYMRAHPLSEWRKALRRTEAIEPGAGDALVTVRLLEK
jgi:hypothetical protein